ncbi:MAG: (d)CMP kinase [Planctomycetota bacterium]|jgi:cytidylate kinase
MGKLIVTIDGPAASGKSTIAKLLAERLGAGFLDTGAMYRAVTLAAMQAGADMSSEEALIEVMKKKEFRFDIRDSHTAAWIDGVDVSEQIREQEVTDNVHYIADAVAIRSRLVEMQRKFATEHERIVTEGRDQGTVAFADADVKFYLCASASERAKRRAKELLGKGKDVDISELEKAIAARDENDKIRAVGALKAADDAIMVDSTKFSIEEVVEKVFNLVKENVINE